MRVRLGRMNHGGFNAPGRTPLDAIDPQKQSALARFFFPLLFYACFPALFLLLACCTNFADSSSSSSICASLDLITSERSLCEFRKKQTVIKTDGDT